MAKRDRKAKPETRRVLGTETRILPVKLTEPELATRGRAMGLKRAALATVEEEFAGVKADYKGRLETLEGEVRGLGRILAAGQESREVKCERAINWAAEQVELIRLDTARWWKPAGSPTRKDRQNFSGAARR